MEEEALQRNWRDSDVEERVVDGEDHSFEQSKHEPSPQTVTASSTSGLASAEELKEREETCQRETRLELVTPLYLP